MKIYIVSKDMYGTVKQMWAYDNAEDALASARNDSLDGEEMTVTELNFYPTKLREFLS